MKHFAGAVSAIVASCITLAAGEREAMARRLLPAGCLA